MFFLGGGTCSAADASEFQHVSNLFDFVCPQHMRVQKFLSTRTFRDDLLGCLSVSSKQKYSSSFERVLYQISNTATSTGANNKSSVLLCASRGG